MAPPDEALSPAHLPREAWALCGVSGLRWVLMARLKSSEPAADCRAGAPTAPVASHSSLHAAFPTTTQLWNLALSSLCQEPRTLWVPTFHCPLKGLPVSRMSSEERRRVWEEGTKARVAC